MKPAELPGWARLSRAALPGPVLPEQNLERERFRAPWPEPSRAQRLPAVRPDDPFPEACRDRPFHPCLDGSVASAYR
jgi:hypothetical protein